MGRTGERLRAELDDARAGLERVRSRLHESQGESGGEIALVDQHPADAASETEARELDITRERMLAERVDRLEGALRRIDSGEYGRCAVCGRQIPEERLEAIPETPFCVEHASRESRS